MKKTAKVAALLAAMALTAGFCACQEKGSAGGAPKYSAKDAEKAAGYLVMDGTTVLGFKEGLPEKLVIPQDVTAIGESAFSGCESIKSVVIPGSVTSIGENAFGGCYNLTSVFIPEGVTEIGKSAFSGCSKLASVTIPNTVTTIGERAFSSTGLKSVTIPGSVETIDEQTFYNCKKLESVTISEGVKTIGYKAFAAMYSDDHSPLKNVELPASLTGFAAEVFDCRFELKEFKYAGTKAQWENVYKNPEGLGVWNVIVYCSDGNTKHN